MSTIPVFPRTDLWLKRLEKYRKEALPPIPPPVLEGRLVRIVGLTLEAVGCQEAIGNRCLVMSPGVDPVEAEVVGFSEDKLYLMPTGDTFGIVPNARVIPTGRGVEVSVGEGLLGRVLDGAGQPLDSKGPLTRASQKTALSGIPMNPLTRRPIREPLDVGIRAINALLSVGRGQRMGLFAGTGVGKSILLGMMTRYTNADVIVVGLIGERGREVKEFIENILGEDGLKRAVVVATPADNPPLLRLHGALLATSIAEYFRDQGKEVLLLMDSLTRFAQAQREIALAVGEPPATKGYPPSVFAKLPRLVERSGNGKVGSITAFYTVLVEGDDHNDPVADTARGILDGHIVLSRELADSGHYPAISIESSVSRVITEITTQEHQEAIRIFRRLYSAFRQNQDLINIGAYQRGSDPLVDESVQYFPRLLEFLRQGIQEAVSYEESLEYLISLLSNTQLAKRR